MSRSVRELTLKITYIKKLARGILRNVNNIELPTSQEIKDGDFWDEELLEELAEHLEGCKSTLLETEGKIDNLTRPYRKDKK